MDADIGERLVEWMYQPDNWLISQFAGEIGVSIKALDKAAAADPVLQEQLDLAYTIQEYKIAKGALTGALKESTALRLLEKYHNWRPKQQAEAVNVGFSVFIESMVVKAQTAIEDERAVCQPNRIGN